MSEKEEKRKVIGKISGQLRKEFEELNLESLAIADTMGELLDRKAALFRRNNTLWKLVRQELNISDEQFQLPLSINHCTGEVCVSDKERSYKEKYESLLKMLTDTNK